MSASEDGERGPLAKLREAADRNEGTSKLADALQDYLSVKARDVVNGASRKLGQTVERMTGEGGSGGALAKGAEKLSEGEGPVKGVMAAAGQGVKDKAKNAFSALTGGGGSGGGSGGNKATNIVEDIDVGVPVRVAYNQWSRFTDFGEFAHRVESVEQEDETTTQWRAKIFWSSRNWKGTVTEQVQDQRIAWTSEGAKGTTRGVVTFHPLGENLTRVLLVTEYSPQGFFERTGNLWRAQGRRLRLELKQYRRHIMMLSEEEAGDLEGWRGEIRDSEVVRSHEDAVEEEQEPEEGGEDQEPEEPEEGEEDQEPEEPEEADEGYEDDQYDEEEDQEPGEGEEEQEDYDEEADEGYEDDEPEADEKR
ncbi:SRPBCC family protein [Nocardiopsis ganjiahuensis]|uniref:SRPBCC family protein n=1 Tax=Nocardiopsis ganjiahuensis TaxID=239984 RepID=UPI00034A7FF5|nr:SRPBCC family protein [Nocardiopsis ganjiahuensis]